MQTSTVTVAIMDGQTEEFRLDRNEVNRVYCRSGGKGGQNVNKVETCVILTHWPTGTQVRCEETRHRAKNEERAWERLEEKLRTTWMESAKGERDQERQEQIGCGARGDKRRTYRERDDRVTDHVTGKKARLRDVLRGKLDILHKD